MVTSKKLQKKNFFVKNYKKINKQNRLYIKKNGGGAVQQTKKKQTQKDHEMEKRQFANIHCKKHVLRQFLFLELYSNIYFNALIT